MSSKRVDVYEYEPTTGEPEVVEPEVEREPYPTDEGRVELFTPYTLHARDVDGMNLDVWETAFRCGAEFIDAPDSVVPVMRMPDEPPTEVVGPTLEDLLAEQERIEQHRQAGIAKLVALGLTEAEAQALSVAPPPLPL